jgi:hypothetical protein
MIETYTVKSGDTPSKVADIFGVSVEQLKQYNDPVLGLDGRFDVGLQLRNPNEIPMLVNIAMQNGASAEEVASVLKITTEEAESIYGLQATEPLQENEVIPYGEEFDVVIPEEASKLIEEVFAEQEPLEDIPDVVIPDSVLEEIQVLAQRRDPELFPVNVTAQRRQPDASVLSPVSVTAQRRDLDMGTMSLAAAMQERPEFAYPPLEEVTVDAQRRQPELFPVSVTAQRRDPELFPVSVTAQRKESEQARQEGIIFPEEAMDLLRDIRRDEAKDTIAAWRNIAKGLTLSASDELEAFVASKVNGTSYTIEKARINEEMEEYALYNPLSAIAQETVGLIPGGIASTKALSAMGVVKLPAQGAIETGVYGFNSGESPEERLILGASSAVIGGAVGKLFEKVFDPTLLPSATNSGGLSRLQTDALQSEVSAQKILTAPANMTDDEVVTQLLNVSLSFYLTLLDDRVQKQTR